jgi:hypothetical protein
MRKENEVTERDREKEKEINEKGEGIDRKRKR